MAAIVDIFLFPEHSVGLHWLKIIVHPNSKAALCTGRRKYQNLYSCPLVPESRLWDSLTDRGCFREWLLVNFCGGSEGRRTGEDKRKKLGCGPVPADTSAHPQGAVSWESFSETSWVAERVPPSLVTSPGCRQSWKQMWPCTRELSPAAGNSFKSKGEYEWCASVSVQFGSLVFVLKVQNSVQG